MIGGFLIVKHIQDISYRTKEFLSNRGLDSITEIAGRAKAGGIILQYKEAKAYRGDVPLIIKLNGGTVFLRKNPVTSKVTPVMDAIKAGAKALSYTLYVGSLYEERMYKEFRSIKQLASKHSIPVIAWVEPWGAAILERGSRKTVVFCANKAKELGADAVMMYVPRNLLSIGAVVKAADPLPLYLTPRRLLPYSKLEDLAATARQKGVKGLVLGKNLWRKDPKKVIGILNKLDN